MAKRIYFSCLLLLLISLLWFGSLNYQMSFDALQLWFEKLVPSMFCVMVVVKLLFSLQLFHHLGNLIGKWFSPFFAIDASCFSYVIAMIFLGFPAGAAFVDEQVQAGHLSVPEAKRLIYACSIPTPGFVIMSCGVVLFHSSRIGFQLFLIQICASLLLLLLTRKQKIKGQQCREVLPAFAHALRDAICSSGKTLYMIGGYLMLCMSVVAILVQYFPISIQLLIRILAEFSSGTMLLHQLPLSLSMQLVLLSMLLSFGGCCVHMQVISMCEASHLAYAPYLVFRLLQALLSGLLAFLWF